MEQEDGKTGRMKTPAGRCEGRGPIGTVGVIAALVLCSGCAAVFKSGSESITISSIPPAADVKVNGAYRGPTPAAVTLGRYNLETVIVSKEGYQDVHVQVQHHLDVPWIVWDAVTCVIPITLCIPIVVDAISGALMSPDEDHIATKLDPVKAPDEAVKEQRP
jgi:hypothetical protein